MTFPGERSSVLAAIRVRDGRVIRYRWIRGTYGVPLVAYDGTAGGLSHDERTLVLASGTPRLASGTISSFAILGTRRLQTRAIVKLRGVFSYGAVSPDASTLYVIEHLPGRDYDYARYRVRAYDLRADRLLGHVPSSGVRR